MKHITKAVLAQLTLWHVLAVFSWLALALLGRPLESQAGWLTYPPCLAELGTMSVRRKEGRFPVLRDRLCTLWCHLRHSWSRPALRSLLLDVLWGISGRQGPPLLLLWPWVLWLWQALAVGWPELRRLPVWEGGDWVLWQGQRVLVVGYLGLTVHQVWRYAGEGRSGMPASGSLLGMSCLVCEQEGPWVDVVQHADGSYQATICGHFVVSISSFAHFGLIYSKYLLIMTMSFVGRERDFERVREFRTA